MQTYKYDSLYRIKEARETSGGGQTWKQTWNYDRFGNRTAFSQDIGGEQLAMNNLTLPTVDPAKNRFETGQGYVYDKNGNLINDPAQGGRQFIFNGDNKQTEVKDAQGNTIGRYFYDGEGKRVKKISNTETVIFVYNASGQLVAEYSTQPNSNLRVSYLTTDHLGSPRIITDQNRNVISRKDYAAFGEETLTAQRASGLGYQPDNIRQDYTGYQKDDESGLEYAQARYYNSTHGRFTSVDPLTASASIRDPQTFNRYSYVLNSPYKFTDPLGLLPLTSAGACGQWCQNSGPTVDGSAFRGTDNTFANMFNAMALGRQVAQALTRLASGDWAEIGSGATSGESRDIRVALKNILEKGNAAAQTIAAALINSMITINVLSASVIGASASTDVSNVFALNLSLKAGEISKTDALGDLVINIAREEFATESQLQGNLIHEGSHALAMADVIHSISKGGSYDMSDADDELAAKLADVNYKIHRGGDFLKHGQALQYIDPSGKPNMKLLQTIANQGTGTIRSFLKGRGVKW